MKTNSQKTNSIWMSAAIGFALLLLFAAPQRVVAQWTTSGNNISNTNTGNVGIGTTAPAVKLVVVGASGTGVSDGTTLADFVATGSETARLRIAADNTSGDVFMNVFASTGGYAHNLNLMTNGGNVGIGTTSPLVKLHTKGAGFWESASLNGISITPGASLQTIASDWNSGGGDTPILLKTQGGGNQLYLGTTGNVGIGTTSPGHALDVNGTVRSRRSDTNYSFVLSPGGTDKWGLYVESDNSFKLREAGVADRLTILTTSGNVGIGTTSPGYKLDVNGNTNITGNITASGTINAKYQDVAEWVPSSEKLAAGTVVVLDSTKSNQVIASSVSYDTRVAGVISEQPGIALGEGGANKVLVATTGRVRVKVDATRAPIQVGNLLVASDVSGMAMKSEPVNIGGIQLHRPGSLIGKALEPLTKGQGTILVLLSLQ